MIEFSHPWVLALLLIVPLLAWYFMNQGRKKEGTVKYPALSFMVPSMIRRGTRFNFSFKLARLVIIFLTIISLAGPRFVDKLEVTSVEVIDIMMVIDISSSMLADDFPPNRLEAVKKTAREFISNRINDRIGLVVFAGETFLQCPLTVDKGVLLDLLSEVQIVDREYDGTAIGMVIANAVNRLRDSDAKSKVMILLSDGSNNTGELDPITASELAAQFDIRIYTIGAGTNQSVTYIPNRGYIQNEIDEETLKTIARTTGGKYFRATDLASLEDVYQQINDLERTVIDIRNYTRYSNIFSFFLIPAAILGILLGFVENLKFGRSGK